MCTEKEKKYVHQRKRMLKEMKSLVYQRTQLSKQVRDLQRDMNAWDRALITD